jgi:hypothetical protein
MLMKGLVVIQRCCRITCDSAISRTTDIVFSSITICLILLEYTFYRNDFVSGMIRILTIPTNLYRIVILPQRITSDKHVRYSYTYFAIQHNKRDYLLYTETDYNRCYRGSVTLCPSNVPIFSAQTKTCEMSLYFQTSAAYSLCRRQLIYDFQAPVFQKFGTSWIYYFSTPHSITLRCHKRQWTNLLQLTSVRSRNFT